MSKICKECGVDWKIYGRIYARFDSPKIDYWCSKCHSKKVPIYAPQEKVVGQLRKQWPSPIKNILIIGDIHEPFCLKGYQAFCEYTYHKYNCDHVIFMGDIIDQHYASFFATDPDGLGGSDELDFAIAKIQGWSKIFPVADVCMGNHDKIILRKAFSSGISKRWIKDFKDVLGVNWNFQPSFIYYDTLLRHGVGQKASPKAGSEMMNVIQGHFHTEGYVHYKVGRGKMIFGMQVPSGIDRETYAMAYAEEHPKPAIGCSVLLDKGTTPIVEMMDLERRY